MKVKLDPVRKWVIALLIGMTAVLSYGVALLNQNIDQATHVGNQNNLFLRNFDNYMRCLVAPNEALYAEIGKEAYYDYCAVLLFVGTDVKPRPSSPTTTASTTG